MLTKFLPERHNRNVKKVIGIDQTSNTTRNSDTEGSNASCVPSPPLPSQSPQRSNARQTNQLGNIIIPLNEEEHIRVSDEITDPNPIPVGSSPISTALDRTVLPQSTTWNFEPALESLYDLARLSGGPSSTSEVTIPTQTPPEQETWTRPGVTTYDLSYVDSHAPIDLAPPNTDAIIDEIVEELPPWIPCGPPTPSGAVEFAPSLDQELELREPPATILLRDFSERLCCFMQSVSHRDNPFRNIYLSTALDGFRCINNGQTISQVSLASVSVYHTVLAAAALSLASYVPHSSRPYIGRIACLHRTKGLEAARRALVGKISNYRHVLTAILCLVSVDVSENFMR